MHAAGERRQASPRGPASALLDPGRCRPGVGLGLAAQARGAVVTMTVYAHVLPGGQREAADRFAALVGGAQL